VNSECCKTHDFLVADEGRKLVVSVENKGALNPRLIEEFGTDWCSMQNVKIVDLRNLWRNK
jgi:hypothetical protein